MFYTEPRYTKNIDIWIEPSPDNAEKVFDALRRFGAPVKSITVKDLTRPDMVYQIGVEPNRIDILMGIGELSFSQVWKRKRLGRYGAEKIYFPALEDITRAKKAAGRLQDRLDLQRLSEKKKKKRP